MGTSRPEAPSAEKIAAEKAEMEKRVIEAQNQMRFTAAKCGVKSFVPYVDSDNPDEKNVVVSTGTLANQNSKLVPLLLGDKNERIIHRYPDDGSHHIRVYKNEDGGVSFKALGIIKGREGYKKAYAEQFTAAKWNGCDKPHMIFDFDSVEEVQKDHLDMVLELSREKGVPIQWGKNVQIWLKQAAQMEIKERKDPQGRTLMGADNRPLKLTDRDWYIRQAGATMADVEKEKVFADLSKAATFDNHTKKMGAQPKIETEDKYLTELFGAAGTRRFDQAAADKLDAELKSLEERVKQFTAAQKEFETNKNGFKAQLADDKDPPLTAEQKVLVNRLLLEGTDSRQGLLQALEVEQRELNRRLDQLQRNLPAAPADPALHAKHTDALSRRAALQANLTEAAQKVEPAAREMAEVLRKVGTVAEESSLRPRT